MAIAWVPIHENQGRVGVEWIATCSTSQIFSFSKRGYNLAQSTIAQSFESFRFCFFFFKYHTSRPIDGHNLVQFDSIWFAIRPFLESGNWIDFRWFDTSFGVILGCYMFTAKNGFSRLAMSFHENFTLVHGFFTHHSRSHFLLKWLYLAVFYPPCSCTVVSPPSAPQTSSGTQFQCFTFNDYVHSYAAGTFTKIAT